MKNKLSLISILISSLWFFSSFLISKVGYAKDINSAWILTEVSASSAVVFNGSGYVKAIYVSTETDGSTLNNFVQLIDTPNVTANSVYSSYTSSIKKSHPIIFQSTYTVSNPNSVVYPDVGVFISSAATVWKSVTNSGEARKAYILWSK